MKTFTMEDVERSLEWTRKKERAKAKVKSFGKRAGAWFNRNQVYVLTLAPIGIGLLGTVGRQIGRNINLRKEKQVKDLYCYDRSLGHYWALKRELTNSEWVKIDKRKANGERLADILAEMKVLK